MSAGAREAALQGEAARQGCMLLLGILHMHVHSGFAASPAHQRPASGLREFGVHGLSTGISPAGAGACIEESGLGNKEKVLHPCVIVAQQHG